MPRQQQPTKDVISCGNPGITDHVHLLPAMTARVVIDTADKDDALVVPLSALKTDTAGAYVFVLNDDVDACLASLIAYVERFSEKKEEDRL